MNTMAPDTAPSDIGTPTPPAALVTGGSRGIGRAIAIKLAADGHPVAVTYRSDQGGADQTVEAIRAEGGTAVALQADVKNTAESKSVLATAEAELGPILVLVNNAGVSHNALAVRVKDDDWADTLDTNLTGAFSYTRSALSGMIRARWGRVVMISSAAGLRGNPGQAAYSASKAGMIGLARSVAREVASRNITVNTVAPGIVDTALAHDAVEKLVGAVPAGRAGTPAEIAAAVSYLVSPAAAYVTGAVLPVDGGLTV